MTPETDSWQRMWSLFHEVRERPAEQRVAYLDEQCGGDTGLRREVSELVEAHEASDTLLEPETNGQASTDEDQAPGPAEGLRIGRYTVRRTIATGGMGVVYEAVQDHPHRVVALKVLRRGAATPQALNRFQHEAEFLGRLRHPGIAQVHDAGTFDMGEGVQPYFAMEFVNGRPLIEDADARSLGTRQRLELFARICDAVQHAHTKGVIHRDLKPDNILVDEHHEPKILDFGIARATDSDIQTTTLRTDIGQLIGTVPYMSPEQVSGDPYALDARSDVYSLGVVLYELLCGRLPHDLRGKTIPDAVRVIREEDPTPLSSIDRVFRGDLETIVAKALEKECDRRYQSAAELAADVRHYLDDEPIVARPASTLYQLRKFTRRNRTQVTGVVGMFVLLVAGTVVSSIGFANAKEEAARSAAINAFLMKLFAVINPAEQSDELSDFALTPRAATLVDLVDEMSKELETAFTEWPVVRADLHMRLGKAYWGWGHTKPMTFHFERARDLYIEHLGRDELETLLAQYWCAEAYLWLDPTKAEVLFRQAAKGLADVLGEEDRHTLGARMGHSKSLRSIGRYREAETIIDHAIEITEPFEPDDKVRLGARRFKAYLLHTTGRHTHEVEVAVKAYEAGRSLPDGDQVRAELAAMLAKSRFEQGHREEALRLYRESYDAFNRQSAGVTRGAIVVTYELALLLQKSGQEDAAEELLHNKIKDCVRVLGPDHEHTLWIWIELGQILRVRGDLGAAKSLLSEKLAHFEQVHGEHGYGVIFAVEELANVLFELKEFEEAERLLRRALVSRCRDNVENIRAYQARISLINLLIDRGKLDAAEPLLREQIKIQRRVHGPDNIITLWAMGQLAWMLKDTQPPDLDEAEGLLRDAVTRQLETVVEDDKWSIMLISRLGYVLYHNKKLEEAESWFRKSEEMSARLHGPDSINTLWEIGQRAWVVKDYVPPRLDEAEELLRDAVTRQLTTVTEDDKWSIMLMSRYGFVLKLSRKLGRAESWFRRALEMSRRLHGEDHEDTLRTKLRLARALNGLARRLLNADGTPGDAHEALSLAVEANELTEYRRPALLNTLAVALHREGRTAEAIENQKKALGLLPADDEKRPAMEAELAEFEAAMLDRITQD